MFWLNVFHIEHLNYLSRRTLLVLITWVFKRILLAIFAYLSCEAVGDWAKRNVTKPTVQEPRTSGAPPPLILQTAMLLATNGCNTKHITNSYLFCFIISTYLKKILRFCFYTGNILLFAECWFPIIVKNRCLFECIGGVHPCGPGRERASRWAQPQARAREWMLTVACSMCFAPLAKLPNAWSFVWGPRTK